MTSAKRRAEPLGSCHLHGYGTVRCCPSWEFRPLPSYLRKALVGVARDVGYLEAARILAVEGAKAVGSRSSEGPTGATRSPRRDPATIVHRTGMGGRWLRAFIAAGEAQYNARPGDQILVTDQSSDGLPEGVYAVGDGRTRPEAADVLRVHARVHRGRA